MDINPVLVADMGNKPQQSLLNGHPYWDSPVHNVKMNTFVYMHKFVLGYHKTLNPY